MLLAVSVVSSVAHAAVLRHALIVGANEGGSSLEPLRYAELDAQRVSDVLTELGGFDPAHITVLYAPTAADLRDALHAHADVSGSFDDDLFVFYYSGHADSRGLRLGQEIYAFDALRGDIRAMPAEVKLGVLDACRSGTITRLKGAALSQPFLVDDRLAAEGEAWMTATSADEAAQESDKLRGSFFTHYLLSGLRGAADTGDGQVSLDEARTYAFDRTVDHTGGTEAGAQHPHFDIRLKGQSEVMLTRVSEGRATVTLPEDLVGDVFVVRMPDRTPVAEVAKKEGAAMTLALTPGTYKFRVVNGKDMKEALVGLADGSRIVQSRWGTAIAESGTSKGAGGTFALDALELARQSSREGAAWAHDATNWKDRRHSPLIAGLASTAFPGVGQFYNGEWVKGGALFAGTFALLGGSLVVNTEDGLFRGSITGPDFVRMSGAMLYGMAIADASFQARHAETWRPTRGFTVSTAANWNPVVSMGTPFVAGLNVEFPVRDWFSVGADRLGWTGGPDGSSTWNAGTRMMFFYPGDHVRPAVFAGIGGRVHAPEGAKATLTPVATAGVDLRWYVTPRYFIGHELRLETEGGPVVFLLGGGLGVHFGG